ncbi:MAG TPA: TIR domain-containing protein, partial [Gemmatimonadales bacterium]|nr:TIR domain-containing protein [Gemmatimonadales bacterium]
EKVLGLAERLRQDGLDAQLDRYVNGTPEEGWPRWMLDRLDEATSVLVVCTETYYRRFRGHEVPGRGRGADWEGALITQEIYDSASRTAKFVPVLLEAGQEPFIPEPLRGQTFYELTSEESYQELYRFLMGQAAVEPIPLGKTRTLLRRIAKPARFGKRHIPLLLWLLAPTAVLLPLVALSTFWRVSTDIQLDFETSRLAFTLGGKEIREVLNSSVPFSSLVIENCGTAELAAETLEIADPQQLIETEPGERPHFPDTAWREVQPRGPVKLLCRDPDAKLTLQHPDPKATHLGLLDRIYIQPGSQVILEISPGREPALSLEVETPQNLNLTLGPDLELVTDHVEPEGLALPFRGDLQTWRVRLPKARRTFEVTSSKAGMVLIVTPARHQAAELFPEKLGLLLASLELTEEDPQARTRVSSLRDTARLSYPDYPDVQPVIIPKDEAVDFAGLRNARLRRLTLDDRKGTLHVVFEATATDRLASGDRTSARDNRLMLYHTFRYSWRWGLIAVAAAWLVSTTWAAFGVWKQLRG